MKSGGVVALVTLALTWARVDSAVAQNDWQFPDPYFGILEIEKSRSLPGERRYRPEIRQPPRGSSATRRTIRSTRRQRGGPQHVRGPSP